MLTAADRREALDLAVAAIDRALRTRRRWLPDVDTLPAALQEPGAAFVTLRRDGELRGCIGSLSAYQPLGIDIARHAADAAFSDPRFLPVTLAEVPHLHVDVSVLTPPEVVPVSSWDALLHAVRPGTDGLLVESGSHRGTLLPAVWESLPVTTDFLDALWRKAGLPPRAWPPDLVVSRYTAEEFGGEAGDHAPSAMHPA